MHQKIVARKGYRSLHGLVPIRTKDVTSFVRVVIQEGLFERTKGITDKIQILSKEDSNQTFQEVLRKVEKIYSVRIEIDGQVTATNVKYRMPNVQNQTEKVVSLFITAA